MLPSLHASRSSHRALGVVALTLLPGIAAAQQGPVSVDPEMVNPRFGHNTVPGVAAPDADVKNTVRFGVFMQYQRNPVVGYRLDEEVGNIVSNRLQAHLGVSWDFTEWGTLRVVVPGGANWGTDIPDFEASGVGLGDIYLGLQFLPFRSKYFNVGLQGDVWFPSGRSEFYLGEPSIRGGGGLQLMGKVPIAQVVFLDIVGDASVIARPIIVTDQDFDAGPDLNLSESLRLRVPLGKAPTESDATHIDLAFTQAFIARSAFTNFFAKGAETAMEIYGGVQLPIYNVGFNTNLTIDLMAGRGLNQGYGATDFRFLGGLTVTRNPGRKPKPEIVVVERPPPVIPPPPEEPEEPPVWGEEEKAKVVDEQIVISDPIEFFVDTANIKPESLPVLNDVAKLMNKEARIGHLVIEGHASAEGDTAYNYELSEKRAEAVYKQLVLDGVPPDRLSYRAFGEVRPKVEGDTEEAYVVNRRVEFHIVSQIPSDAEAEKFKDYGDTTTLPWNGASWKVVTPTNPAEIRAQKEAEEAAQREEERKRDDFQVEDDDGEFSFEEEESAPLEEEDAFEGTSFDEAGSDEFSFEDEPAASGALSDDAPVTPEEVAPAEEPAAEEAPAEEPAPPAEESAPADEPAPADDAQPDDAPAEEAM